MMKTCARCHVEQPEENFYRHPRNGRLYPYCLPCNREYQRERKQKRGANGDNASNGQAVD